MREFEKDYYASKLKESCTKMAAAFSPTASLDVIHDLQIEIESIAMLMFGYEFDSDTETYKKYT